MLLHVLRLAGYCEVFKHVSQELKGWPLERVGFPTLQHYLERIYLVPSARKQCGPPQCRG